MSLPEEGEDVITSVSWIKDGGNHLAIGTSMNTVQLWDASRGAQVRTMGGHSARIGSLAWNGCILSSGSRDTTIVNHDVRVANHHVATLRGHSQEVCGLSWSPDGRTLASGSNDNSVALWDAAASGLEGVGAGSGSTTFLAPSSAHHVRPRSVLVGHNAAVKALAWSPHDRHVLATGGGSSDRTVKLWNASTGALLSSTDAGSQVSSLLWSPHSRELLSGHGFSENQLTLWSAPSMTRLAELKGHTERVLHMAASPDGSSVVSAGADETLRFWSVFGEPAGAAVGGAGGAVGTKAVGVGKAAVAGKAGVAGAGGSLMNARQIR